jgi:branched-chain amino acid aminotransferase
MALDNERVAWFNGKIVPESQVMIPFRDSSFLRGDGVFDMTRTFDGRIFRLEEHVARLYRSLKYVGIDCGVAQEQMLDISREVVERNRHLLAPNEDYWLGQRISRGVKQVAGDHWDHYGPNVIVECIPLPFAERAKQFVEGIEVITPSVRRTPPEALSPRAKMHQYLNMILAEQEVRAQNPDAWAVLLDMHGNLSEGQGCNIFLVTDGKLATPRERFVLPGISRQAVIDLANELGIACEEKDIDLYDAYTADECFITSTSWCICGVRSLNGKTFAAGAVPGPVTARLTEAYKALVDCDFVGQYTSRLNA